MLTGRRADDVATDVAVGYGWCNDNDAVVAVSRRSSFLCIPIRRCQSKVPYLYDDSARC